MPLTVVGLSHKTAPVEVREKLSIPHDALRAALDALKEVEGLREGVLVSTCNRTEIYGDFAVPDLAMESVGIYLARITRHEPGELRRHLYCHVEREAVQHIFRVASSLDSMIVGEPQILGQVKEAYAAAHAAHAALGLLNRVMTRAFAVAKRVRGETGIAEHAVSVSYAAVELARTIFGELEGRSVLVIGAGKMGGLTLKHLSRSGLATIYVTNRTLERAVEMASEMGGVVVPYEGMDAALEKTDIVISSAQAPHYILDRERVARLMHTRRNRSLFLIDISVPRSLDPEIHSVDNVYVYDIDDLKAVVEENRRSRQHEAIKGERIVQAETAHFLASLKTLDVAPVIVGLRSRLEALRQAEIERQLGPRERLDPKLLEAVEKVTRGLINKIAHQPITELRRAAAAQDGVETIEALKRVFLDAHGTGEAKPDKSGEDA